MFDFFKGILRLKRIQDEKAKRKCNKARRPSIRSEPSRIGQRKTWRFQSTSAIIKQRRLNKLY